MASTQQQQHQQQQQQQQPVPWQGFDDHIIIGGSTSPAPPSNRQDSEQQSIAARPQSRRFTETFRGFIKDPLDAQLCIEACIEGVLQPLNMVPMSLSDLQIRSGTVLVFAENSQFLLYRQVESATTASTNTETERDMRFVNTVVRGKTRFVANGLAKRTLTLSGSDGNRYRVISYFYPCHVQHLYGDPVAGSSGLVTPSSMPEYARFAKRGGSLHSFSMPDLSYSALLRNSTNAKQLVETIHRQSIQSIQSNQSNQSNQSIESIESIESIKSIQSISKKHSMFSSPPSNASPKVMTPQSMNLNASCPNHVSSSIEQVKQSDDCECGGLGSKRHFNYFETNPFWTEFPVTLAPISNRQESE
ncbi:hypothetical protein CcCBS67573_g09123 [Chytriomyces confervae]|uniref:Uncharacterized protein n=1 Tax=Chytriomyces confervae TaxID=246404 RepID=A0A507E711_9FUNG|nr:hypothetical protein CcCBS67573_g09123 [Chytriomyces confervae]